MAVLETAARQPDKQEIERRPVRLSIFERSVAGFLFPLALLVVWEALIRLGLIEVRLMPAPSRIFETVYELAVAGELAGHIGITLWRVLVGFFAGQQSVRFSAL